MNLFFETSCDEFSYIVKKAESEKEFYNFWYAEKLCEEARSITLQYIKLTLKETQKLIELFERAITSISRDIYLSMKDKQTAFIYIEHIQRRIDNLKDNYV